MAKLGRPILPEGHPDRCEAKSRTTGKQCARDKKAGLRVCFYHGGATPASKAKSERFKTDQKAMALFEKYTPAKARKPVDNPVEMLLTVASEIAAFKDFIGERVAELRADEWRYSDRAGEQLRAEIAIYERALDRTARILVDISRLGLEERLVRIEERQASQMVAAWRRAIDSVDLPQGKRDELDAAVIREYRALEGQ